MTPDDFAALIAEERQSDLLDVTINSGRSRIKARPLTLADRVDDEQLDRIVGRAP